MQVVNLSDFCDFWLTASLKKFGILPVLRSLYCWTSTEISPIHLFLDAKVQGVTQSRTANYCSASPMDVGRGGGGCRSLGFWNLTFSNENLAKKGFSLSFKWVKSNFISFPPWKNPFGYSWKNTLLPSLVKSFRRSWVVPKHCYCIFIWLPCTKAFIISRDINFPVFVNVKVSCLELLWRLHQSLDRKL